MAPTLKTLFLHAEAGVIRAAACLLRIFPLHNRVAFLSRQSNKASLDYRLLIAELQTILNEDQIATCLIEPETKGMGSFILGTCKQLYYACTSRVVVIDDYVPAVSIPSKDGRVTVVQMWHALGAIKKFGYQCVGTSAGRSEAEARIGRMHKNYDWIIAGGESVVPAFTEAFNYPPATILPLGLPRIDYLLDPDPHSQRREKDRALRAQYPFLDNGKRNVLYAPTLRKGSGYEGWFSQSVEAIAKHCNNDVNLIIAGHPLDNGLDASLLVTYPVLHLIEGVATINLLESADVVISDYSAIIFEAALLHKHIELYMPDLEQYQQSPGLNIDPHEGAYDLSVFQAQHAEFNNATHTIATFIKDRLDG